MLKKAIEALLSERNELKKELDVLHLEKAAQVKGQLISQFEEKDDHKVLIAQVSLPNADALKKAGL